MKYIAASARQIRFLEARGFRHVVDWSFEDAKDMIDRITENGWRVPTGISPAEYRPGDPATAQGRTGQLKEAIIQRLDELNERKLSNVYNFVLHLKGGEEAAQA